MPESAHLKISYMNGLKERILDVFPAIEKSMYTRYELWKLKAATSCAKMLSSLFSVIVIFFIAAVSFIILSIGAAYWIGLYMKRISDGFFIVGGFYIVVGFLVFVFRKNIIKTPVQNKLLDKIID